MSYEQQRYKASRKQYKVNVEMPLIFAHDTKPVRTTPACYITSHNNNSRCKTSAGRETAILKESQFTWQVFFFFLKFFRSNSG